MLYAILEKLGFDCALLKYPGHIAVGVDLDGQPDEGYVYYEGTRFYYIETTGTGWKIGEVPEDFQGVYPIVCGYETPSAFPIIDGKYHAYKRTYNPIVETALENRYLELDAKK